MLYFHFRNLASAISVVAVTFVAGCGGGSSSCQGDSCEAPNRLMHSTGVPHNHGNGHGGLTAGEVRNNSGPPSHAASGDSEEIGEEFAGGESEEGFSASDEQTAAGSSYSGEMLADQRYCIDAVAPSGFGLLFSESFGGGGSCAATAGVWDSAFGIVENVGGDCRLSYTVPAGTDEQEPAKVTAISALQQLAGIPIQTHLRVEWSDYFQPGYEFPAGSQKLARFFTSWGATHEANVMILNQGRSVQGTVFIKGIDERGQPALFETVGWLEFPDGVPVGQEVPASLEVKMPSTEREGWLDFSFAEKQIRLQIPRMSADAGSCTTGFDGLWIGGNWTNQGRLATRDSTRYIDDIAVYGEHS